MKNVDPISKTDLLSTYFIGKYLQYIVDCTFMNDVLINPIIDTLSNLYDELNDGNLSIPTQTEVYNYMIDLENKVQKTDKLSSIDKQQLYSKVNIWSDRIDYELVSKKIIHIYENGTIYPNKLLKGPAAFFTENNRNNLSYITKNDLNDACYCLLTGSWTPAVMVSLRAAESEIRNMYLNTIGSSTNNKSWGSIINELLDNKNIAKPIYGFLDYIRDARNSAEHPDKIFYQIEAETLFYQVISLITAIHQELDAGTEE